MTEQQQKEVGGGFSIRGHVHPWLIHVDVWQKPSQNCKVIILQLNLKKFLSIMVKSEKSGKNSVQ